MTLTDTQSYIHLGQNSRQLSTHQRVPRTDIPVRLLSRKPIDTALDHVEERFAQLPMPFGGMPVEPALNGG